MHDLDLARMKGNSGFSHFVAKNAFIVVRITSSGGNSASEFPWEGNVMQVTTRRTFAVYKLSY